VRIFLDITFSDEQKSSVSSPIDERRKSLISELLILYILAHNQLQYLPVEMWSAPMLTDLNVANNSLKELPAPTVVAVKNSEKMRRHMTCM
jgi:hypothetical protein